MLKAFWSTALVNQEVPITDFDLIALHQDSFKITLEDHKSECCQVLDVAKCAWCHWSFLAIVSAAAPAEWKVVVRDISMYRIWWHVQIPTTMPLPLSSLCSSGFPWVVKCGFIIWSSHKYSLKAQNCIWTILHCPSWSRKWLSCSSTLRKSDAMLSPQKVRHTMPGGGERRKLDLQRIMSSFMPLRSAVLQTENVLLPALHLCWQVQQTRHLRFQQYFLKSLGRARLRAFLEPESVSQ